MDSLHARVTYRRAHDVDTQTSIPLVAVACNLSGRPNPKRSNSNHHTHTNKGMGPREEFYVATPEKAGEKLTKTH